MITAPYSPSVRATVRTMPQVSPSTDRGKVIRQNVCHQLEPRVAAALLVGAQPVQHRFDLADDGTAP